MIKRYKLNIQCPSIGDLIEDDHGEWVKWNDIEDAICDLGVNYHSMQKLLGNKKCVKCGLDLEGHEIRLVGKIEGYQPSVSTDPIKEPPKNPNGMIQPSEPWPKPEAKCNCQEKLEECKDLLDEYVRVKYSGLYSSINAVEPNQEWICPVHGYKKR